MSDLRVKCQVCGKLAMNWRVTEARFDVGYLQNYKLQACQDCQNAIERAINAALAAARIIP